MKVIYIAGPYRAENAWKVERNVRAAEELAWKVSCMGAMPLCPHSMTRFWNGTHDEGYWLDGTLELLRRCDAVLMVQGWEHSDGSIVEYGEAKKLNIPVFDKVQDLAGFLLLQPLRGQHEGIPNQRDLSVPSPKPDQ